ncbi:hypothetical protein B0H13DRAFT_1904681 [Mycena leptocephala]|nr:hypothetical protein B0H13DRAFT_1904681 [Mycena leptocephala]
MGIVGDASPGRDLTERTDSSWSDDPSQNPEFLGNWEVVEPRAGDGVPGDSSAVEERPGATSSLPSAVVSVATAGWAREEEAAQDNSRAFTCKNTARQFAVDHVLRLKEALQHAFYIMQYMHDVVAEADIEIICPVEIIIDGRGGSGQIAERSISSWASSRRDNRDYNIAISWIQKKGSMYYTQLVDSWKFWVKHAAGYRLEKAAISFQRFMIMKTVNNHAPARGSHPYSASPGWKGGLEMFSAGPFDSRSPLQPFAVQQARTEIFAILGNFRSVFLEHLPRPQFGHVCLESSFYLFSGSAANGFL